MSLQLHQSENTLRNKHSKYSSAFAKKAKSRDAIQHYVVRTAPYKGSLHQRYYRDPSSTPSTSLCKLPNTASHYVHAKRGEMKQHTLFRKIHSAFEYITDTLQAKIQVVPSGQPAGNSLELPLESPPPGWPPPSSPALPTQERQKNRVAIACTACRLHAARQDGMPMLATLVPGNCRAASTPYQRYQHT